MAGEPKAWLDAPDRKLPSAIKNPIRPLDCNCTSWTRQGFFPGAASDRSLPATELSKAL